MQCEKKREDYDNEKTEEVSLGNLLEILEIRGTILLDHVNYSLSWIQMIKYVEKNQFC